MSKFSQRVIVPEIIDDFNLSGKTLAQNLEEIEWINKNLGGTSVSAYPVLTYIQKNLRKQLRIVDVGCGSGDLLKKIQLACDGVKQLELVGIDANPNIIEFAKQRHFSEKQIRFIQADVINDPSSIPDADIYLLNLFLHHFEEKEVRLILQNLVSRQPALIVVNDLQRSRIAYILFSLVCQLKNASFVTFHDGRLSILKGFNLNEMKKMAQGLDGYTFRLHWKWAFRWQLLIDKKQ